MKTWKFQRCISTFPLALVLISSIGHAEIYKWVDESGRTHYSERKENTGKIIAEELKVPSSSSPRPVQMSPADHRQEQDRQFRQRQIEKSNGKSHEPPPVNRPLQMAKSKSTPADPSQIRPGCQDLINRIATVKPGTKWEQLSENFNSSCPGIGYECNYYKSHPENNKCEWIKRTGSNIMQTNNYP